VQNGLRELRRAGFLTIDANANGGRSRVPRYRATLSEKGAAGAPLSDSLKGARDDPKRSAQAVAPDDSGESDATAHSRLLPQAIAGARACAGLTRGHRPKRAATPRNRRRLHPRGGRSDRRDRWPRRRLQPSSNQQRDARTAVPLTAEGVAQSCPRKRTARSWKRTSERLSPPTSPRGRCVTAGWRLFGTHPYDSSREAA
jgi:hypothetical protein